MSSVDRHRWRDRLDGGLYPAVVVPMNDGRAVDSAALDQYIGYMNEQPADGIALWVHTSRGLKMDRRMRLDLLKAWRAGMKPDRLIIAGAGGLCDANDTSSAGDQAYVDFAVSMARDAAEFGAEALLVWAPVRFRGRPDQDAKIIEYHRAIAAVGLPMIVFYLYESAGGVTYSLDVLRELFAMPEVVGIKMATLDSVMTYQDVSTLIGREFADVTLITGEDRFLGYSIMRGASAALIGMGAACTAMQKRLLEAYRAGRAEAFLDLSAKVDAFAEATFIAPMEGYIRRMLWTLHLLGVIDRSACHDPWGPPLPETQFQNLKMVLEQINAG